MVGWDVASSSMRWFRATGILAALAFAVLLGTRLGLWDALLSQPRSLPGAAAADYSERESWMSIFQNNRQVGFSHSRLRPGEAGYTLEETVRMRINTMGMVQELRLNSRFLLNRELALEQFEFGIASDRFRFSALGRVAGDVLTVETDSGGGRGRIDIPAAGGIRPVAALADALARADLAPGTRYELEVFDPAAMARVPVIAEIIGPEEIEVMGAPVTATRITLNFRGMIQTAWIGPNGDLLRERGLLGMRLEKSSREQALTPLGREAGPDLAEAAAITPDRPSLPPRSGSCCACGCGGRCPMGCI